jgi:hypothetical protein
MATESLQDTTGVDARCVSDRDHLIAFARQVYELMIGVGQDIHLTLDAYCQAVLDGPCGDLEDYRLHGFNRTSVKLAYFQILASDIYKSLEKHASFSVRDETLKWEAQPQGDYARGLTARPGGCSTTGGYYSEEQVKVAKAWLDAKGVPQRDSLSDALFKLFHESCEWA